MRWHCLAFVPAPSADTSLVRISATFTRRTLDIIDSKARAHVHDPQRLSCGGRASRCLKRKTPLMRGRFPFFLEGRAVFRYRNGRGSPQKGGCAHEAVSHGETAQITEQLEILL